MEREAADAPSPGSSPGSWSPAAVQARPAAIFDVFAKGGQEIYPHKFTFAARAHSTPRHSHSLYEDVRVFGVLDRQKRGVLVGDLATIQS